MKEVHNFNAGPCVLPKEAVESTINAIRNFDNTGIGLMEISHRTPGWERLMAETRQLWRDLLNIPDNYEVLFLGGGASTQFFMVPANLMKTKAAYLQTGVWAKKAAKEAKNFGKTEIIASSEDKTYNYIPKGWTVPADADYFHITTNNTIYGTEIRKDFNAAECNNVMLVADMSSDIMSRPVDVTKYGLIYGGAQKNVGPAGVTFVIVRKDMLRSEGPPLRRVLRSPRLARQAPLSLRPEAARAAPHAGVAVASGGNPGPLRLREARRRLEVPLHDHLPGAVGGPGRAPLRDAFQDRGRIQGRQARPGHLLLPLLDGGHGPAPTAPGRPGCLREAPRLRCRRPPEDARLPRLRADGPGLPRPDGLRLAAGRPVHPAPRPLDAHPSLRSPFLFRMDGWPCPALLLRRISREQGGILCLGEIPAPPNLPRFLPPGRLMHRVPVLAFLPKNSSLSRKFRKFRNPRRFRNTRKFR